MHENEETNLDEILGRTRCARCGEILNAEIECPFCSLFPEETKASHTPKWVYITACFLTSPLSLPFLIVTHRMTIIEKIIAGSGMLAWAAVYWLL
ncbi:MAG TPA: hypothetical protein VFG95_08975 [Nitrospiria bacterium]|nr:hypothetical protein [Nitrospiria bacterium]